MSNPTETREKSLPNPLKSEAQAYLAAIVESTDDAIISKNLNGIITSWNSSAERIFGYSASEAVGKHISLIIPKDRLHEEDEIISKIRRGERIDHFSTVRCAKDGALIDVNLTISPIRGREGQIIGASEIARDIGVYKRAQRASAYLAAIVESSDDAIISKNLDGIITTWNAAAERIFGYTADEAIGRPITLIIPPAHFDEEKVIIARLRRGEKIDHFETIRQAKDGKLLNVSITVSPIRDADGRIIGASKVSRDITEKKRQEEALRSQQEWFEVTLASIGDAVIATDVEGRVTYLNSIAEKLTGWLTPEAKGKSLEEVFSIINEDTREPTQNPVRKVTETGAIHGLANHTVLVSRNGLEYSIEDAAAPIRLPDGRLIGVVLVFHDIGDRRVLEKELHRRAAMLVEKDRRKDEFLAMLAHELRNPLAPISNALQILKTTSMPPEMQREIVAMADRQVAHMVRLLDDLLDVSRVTHGKIAMRYDRIDLREIIRTAIDSAQPLIRQRNHAFSIHLPDCPVWVKGDATRLSQLFGNLLNNAAKYTRNGGRITLDLTLEREQAVIRVRDNGIGIPPEKLPHIFDMFMQVDNSMERSHGGLGIGLTLVKSIAELHQGSVDVASEGEGRGTEFTVRLPVMENISRIVSEEAGQRGDGLTQNPRRILVVDDNEASAKTLSWMLEAMGHEVNIAFNGQEAMQLARAHHPDIVMLDIGMPQMNGYELCRELRKDPQLKHTQFIAQTGWGQEEHLKRSRESGFDAHLIKPISMEALRQRVEQLAEREALA